MSTERDVTLRLNTKAGDLGKPMKDLARAAKDAGKEIGDTEAKLKKMEQAANAALIAQGKANAAARAAANAPAPPPPPKGGGHGHGGHGMGRHFGGMLSSFGVGGGVAGGAMAALSMGNRGLNTMQHGGNFGQGIFNRGTGSGQGILDTAVWESGKLPLVGNIFKLSGEYQKLEEKVKRVREAEEALHRTEVRIAMEQPFIARRTALGDQLAQTEARLKFGSSSLGAQYRLGTAGQRQIEAQQDRIANGGGSFGIGRGTAQGDVEARISAQTKGRQMQVEQARQLALLDAKESRTADVVADKQRKLAEARRAAKTAGDNVGAAHQGGGVEHDPDWVLWLADSLPGGAKREGARGDAASAQQADESQRQERALQYQRTLNDLEEAERQFAEALDRQKEESVARGDTLLEQGRARLDLMTQERDRLTGIVRAEKERLQTGREQFGLQDPYTRKGLLELSRKIKRGGELSEAEIQFAQSKGGDLFRPALDAIGAKRAGPDHDELVNNLAGGRRLAEADQARVAFENKISVEIKINEASMTDQLQKQIIPEIHQAVQLMEKSLSTALAKMRLELQNERRPAAGG